jgi:hypothetical protein
MDRLKLWALTVFMAVFCAALPAQNHTSVTLESRVYYVLEQAELKGLCGPLPGSRPYTRSVVIAAVNAILNSESGKRLNDTERAILQQYLDQFAKPQNGMDWQKGIYHGETAIGKNDMPLTLNIGGNLDTEFSSGFYSSFKESYVGAEVWLRIFLNGDIGSSFSWEFSGEGGMMRVPRKELGWYNTYYDGFNMGEDSQYKNQKINIYSEPLTHFPYSYKKRWDGSVFPFSAIDHFESWPDSAAGGYNLLSEMTASFLENRLIIRLGRISREWGSSSFGSSLALNQAARPFLGIEAEFTPFSWFGIATMTGVLEYNNTGDVKDSAMNYQNAFSITMLQFRYKNYFMFDLGETVVWPKRFELGYISPITNSIFYQNNIGDFDNMGMFFTLKGQYPGIGNAWFSLFWDEAWWSRDFYERDRTMIAWQAGSVVSLPFLSFSSIKLSYTKVNPYCYTHNRNFNPWYGGSLPMATSYTNNGVSLGYYLPPNADEILVKFQTMPVKSLTTHLQYQLIRHGADFGPSAVDGSNLQSELDPDGRVDGDTLKRYFLRDGAYQWSHIARVGAEWNIPGLPIALTGEVGAVISYFTNIDGAANDGSAHSYAIVDTAEYPKSTGFIVTIGVRVFPR